MAKHEKQRTQDSTTLSTRFNQAEMENLRMAADLRKWSLSKLLWVGTNQKAVHIVNHGIANQALRRVLADVVQQLFAPSLQGDNDGEMLDEMERCGGSLSCLSDRTFRNLIAAIEDVGEELAPILEEERHRLEAQQFAQEDLRSTLISCSSLKPDSELEPEPITEAKSLPQKSKKSGKKRAKKKT